MIRSILGVVIILNMVSCGLINPSREKAKTSVTDLMFLKNKGYSPIRFGEFFSQYYSEGLQEIAKTEDTIKYSIVHTYSLNGERFEDVYFHLNKTFDVIGQNSKDEMIKLVTDELNNNPKFDSIVKSFMKEIKEKDSLK